MDFGYGGLNRSGLAHHVKRMLRLWLSAVPVDQRTVGDQANSREVHFPLALIHPHRP